MQKWIAASLSEQREIDTAVGPVLHEMRMVGEVVVLAVFQNEYSFRLQKVFFENEVGQCGQLGQRIGRVGKNEVELLPAAFQKAEHVAPQGNACLCAQLLEAVGDEAVMVAVELDADHLPTAAWHQF